MTDFETSTRKEFAFLVLGGHDNFLVSDTVGKNTLLFIVLRTGVSFLIFLTYVGIRCQIENNV